MASNVLDTTSFPLYAIQSVNGSIFICAGGGGAAKTGIKNAIHVYKLRRQRKSYDAEILCEVDTGSRAAMNFHLNPSKDCLAVGMDHLCQFYKVNYAKEGNEDKIQLIKTKSIETTKAASSEEEDDGEYQKCVRFTPDEKHVITGASDGSCRIYKYPSLELKHEIKKAHNEEIDEVDVHPNSKVFVSVSKDTSASLWSVVDGKKELELPFSLDKKDEDFYRFRNCRFSTNKDTDTVFLYTTNIPKKYSKDKPVNCLVKWNTSKWIPGQTVFIKDQTLSSLDASASGRYVGVGTADGSILVYISWNMKHLKTIKKIHDIFVTGLSFIPENKELCEDMSNDAGLLSCSIDNKCQVSLVPSRLSIPFGIVAFFFVAIIGIIFNYITYFDVDL